ncbi:MAG: FHA domain-containing protein [Chloroflexota bacterium]|nr:FHA domain-containing protein [Chloroflexota bacterium]
MTVEITLFALRVVSGGLLLALLALLFVLLWRDYRSAVRQVESTRRSYGRLIELVAFDEQSAMATGQAYPLLPLTSLGRTPTNSIMVDDDFASGEHCLLALRSGRWWLEDRVSRNGTMLNGVLIAQPIIVTDGDIIGIGQRRFRIELEI